MLEPVANALQGVNQNLLTIKKTNNYAYSNISTTSRVCRCYTFNVLWGKILKWKVF